MELAGCGPASRGPGPRHGRVPPRGSPPRTSTASRWRSATAFSRSSFAQGSSIRRSAPSRWSGWGAEPLEQPASAPSAPGRSTGQPLPAGAQWQPPFPAWPALDYPHTRDGFSAGMGPLASRISRRPGTSWKHGFLAANRTAHLRRYSDLPSFFMALKDGPQDRLSILFLQPHDN